jgi:hypothetical protein
MDTHYYQKGDIVVTLDGVARVTSAFEGVPSGYCYRIDSFFHLIYPLTLASDIFVSESGARSNLP